MTDFTGQFWSGKAKADRLIGEYVRIKQGKHVIILTPYQVKKLAERFR